MGTSAPGSEDCNRWLVEASAGGSGPEDPSVSEILGLSSYFTLQMHPGTWSLCVQDIAVIPLL